MTPEMAQKKGYDITVDYYGLGALLYEMVVGAPPFSKYTEEEELVQAIVHTKPLIPSKLSSNLRDLLSRLLEKDPKKRIGAKDGIKEIMSHSWFTDVNFGLIMDKKVIPPIKIELKRLYFGPLDDCIDISSEEAANESSVDLDNMRDDDDSLEEDKQIDNLTDTIPDGNTLALSQQPLRSNNLGTLEKAFLMNQNALQDAKNELFRHATKDPSFSKIDHPIFPQKQPEIRDSKSNLKMSDEKNKPKTTENPPNKKFSFLQNFSLKKFYK